MIALVKIHSELSPWLGTVIAAIPSHETRKPSTTASMDATDAEAIVPSKNKMKATAVHIRFWLTNHTE